MTTASKMGPKEARNRELREARVNENKKLLDKTTKFKAKGIGKVVAVKASKRGRR
jgi:hypothetical protein